jgi:hypothetical protein
VRNTICIVLWLLLGCCSPCALSAIDNTIAIVNNSGEAQAQFPVQLGRPFVRGEIRPGYSVKAVIEGKPVPTQVDVKQRWEDGSLKHAILAFIVDAVPARGTVTVAIRPAAPDGVAGVPLTRAQMLLPRFDFDARMEIGGVSASARAMLEHGDYQAWTNGAIATSVILADHSIHRKYDFSAVSVRPIFHATFWPSLGKVRVRFIGENALNVRMSDSEYDLLLKLGGKAPKAVYEKRAVRHYAATRWTKEFWLGGEPERRVSIDSNLRYLKETGFVPNYDTAPVLFERHLADYYAAWSKRPKDLYDAGLWTKYMPTTGGRSDLGPVPEWVARWLHTGDWRMREIALTSADLAAAWPIIYREGDATKRFDRAAGVPAIGRPVSVNAWANLWIITNNGVPNFVRGSRIKGPDYPYVNGGWHPDGAHQPDPYSVAYMLTGDYWYLEQLQFWAAAWALMYNPAYRPAGIARIADEVRGDAWVFRNRVNAAFLSPDGTPEQSYFKTITEDALAIWEGERKIAGRYAGTPLWEWAQKNAEQSPLHFWRGGSAPRESLVTVNVAATESLWMDYYVMIALAMAKEKGFASGPLLAWHSHVLTSQFSAPGHDPRFLAAYRTPVRKVDGGYFKTWDEIRNEYTDPAEVLRSFSSNAYSVQAAAAAAAIAGEPGGMAAWRWLLSNVREARWYDATSEMRWSIVPRTTDDVHRDHAAASGQLH